MIKAVLFDLDGVLIDADKWHFNALNVALQHSDVEPVSWQEHLNIYKGIPTRVKLSLLTERKGLSQDLWKKISDSKQETTNDIIRKFCTPDPEKLEMMRLLKRKYKIGVCSNSISASVQLMLEKSGLLPFVDFYLSNEDVQNPKPAPDIYFAAFKRLGFAPDECCIVEDSDVGKRAANLSGGVLCSVSNPSEVNYYRVLKTVMENDAVNVVIPAAGQGKRFAEVGHQHPKPLIDIKGKPMIQIVLDNLKSLGRPIVILQKKHIDQYCADVLVKSLNPTAQVACADGLTEGAASTVLLAKEFINNRSEMIHANSDQYVSADIQAFVTRMRDLKADAGLLVFRDNNPKWSYAKTDSNGLVTEVAEKIVISEFATVGIYYYRHGSDFVKYAEQMIQKNVRVNGEFYVCPVFNEMLLDGKKLYIHEIAKQDMHGLGTPEDLEVFLKAQRQTRIIELPYEDVREAFDADSRDAFPLGMAHTVTKETVTTTA